MYIVFLYILCIIFGCVVFQKANNGKDEWVFLLLILSYIVTSVVYLFAGGTVFTIIRLGQTQIHLNDVICFTFIVYLFVHCRHIKKSSVLSLIMLLILPLFISFLRGAVSGTLGSANFLADTRKFIFFIIAMATVYSVMRKDKWIISKEKVLIYMNRFANVVISYTLIIWLIDLLFGINSLPGQKNGLLSDGGSTFRIIHPQQVLIIAFYTLYCLNRDLKYKHTISVRTLLLTGVVLLMQWRTVVAAFLLGFALILYFRLIKEKGLTIKFLKGLFILVIIGGVVTGFSGGSQIVSMITNLFKSFSNISKGRGTFATRTYIWEMLLNSLTGINKLIGRPFGAGQEEGVTWVASAHSGYVDYIMVTGYIGVSALIVFCLYLLVQFFKRKLWLQVALMVTLMVFWYGYGFAIEQGAVLGCLAAQLERHMKYKVLE